MSTGPRVPWSKAQDTLTGFARAIDLDGVCTRWEAAGSFRRDSQSVGDLEIVAESREGIREAGLFGASSVGDPVLPLWKAVDAALERGSIGKAEYGNGHRWGDRYRGVMFRGVRFEIWRADADNWGSILAIRTGPQEFSQFLVTRLRDFGYHHEEGRVRRIEDGVIVPTPTEEEIFKLAGIGYLQPAQRTKWRRQ